jgi:hypothetical protein
MTVASIQSHSSLRARVILSRNASISFSISTYLSTPWWCPGGRWDANSGELVKLDEPSRACCEPAASLRGSLRNPMGIDVAGKSVSQNDTANLVTQALLSNFRCWIFSSWRTQRDGKIDGGASGHRPQSDGHRTCCWYSPMISVARGLGSGSQACHQCSRTHVASSPRPAF